tara:strand:- start:7282 stop:7626 length:345 start_codon:yes stop_codon:yes gene_type:complete
MIGKTVKIIDKGECMSSLNEGPFSSLFRDKNIMMKAGQSEWLKHGFYPADNMTGEIVEILGSPINHLNSILGMTNDEKLEFKDWIDYLHNDKIYVLLIMKKYYVPMSGNGIELI